MVLKLILKRILVFGSLLVGLIAIYLGYRLLDFCLSGLGDAGGNARVWLDENSNGQWDPEEPPMEGVCVWGSTILRAYSDEEVSRICGGSDPDNDNHTDVNGRWPGETSIGATSFFAGASCEDVYIFADPPSGYQATTPLIVDYCYAEFGFVPADTLSPASVSHRDYVTGLVAQEQRLKIQRTLMQVVIVLVTVAITAIASVKLVRS